VRCVATAAESSRCPVRACSTIGVASDGLVFLAHVQGMAPPPFTQQPSGACLRGRRCDLGRGLVVVKEKTRPIRKDVRLLECVGTVINYHAWWWWWWWTAVLPCAFVGASRHAGLAGPGHHHQGHRRRRAAAARGGVGLGSVQCSQSVVQVTLVVLVLLYTVRLYCTVLTALHCTGRGRGRGRGSLGSCPRPWTRRLPPTTHHSGDSHFPFTFAAVRDPSPSNPRAASPEATAHDAHLACSRKRVHPQHKSAALPPWASGPVYAARSCRCLFCSSTTSRSGRRGCHGHVATPRNAATCCLQPPRKLQQRHRYLPETRWAVFCSSVCPSMHIVRRC
jgi:hypothetical protein